MADSPPPSITSSEGAPEASYGPMPSIEPLDFNVDLDFPILPPETLIVNPGPVLIGTAETTGNPEQKLQVTGQSYFSDNVAIGLTYANEKLHVLGNIFVDGEINVVESITTQLFYGDLVGRAAEAEISLVTRNVFGDKSSVLYNYEYNQTTTSPLFTFDGVGLTLGESPGENPGQRLRVSGTAYFTDKIGIGVYPYYSLDVAGVGNFSEFVISPTFYGDLVGTASRSEYAATAGVTEVALTATTSTNVIGGIASVSQLNVSGFSTLTYASAGILTASTIHLSGDLYDETDYQGNIGQVLVKGIYGVKWDVVGNLLPPLQTIEVLDTGIGLTHYVSRINFIDGYDPDNTVTARTGISTEYADIIVSDRWTLVGSGNAGISTNVFRMSSVGIGTTIPRYTLDVRGSVGIGSTLTVSGSVAFSTDFKVSGVSTFNSSVFITGQTEISNADLIVSGTGNVGIGTSVPTSKLDVIGDVKVSQTVTTLNASISSVASVGFLTATNAFVSGIATVGFLTVTNVFVATAATIGFVSATNTIVSGRSTVGFLTATNAFVSGTATVGFLSASNTLVSGRSTVGFLTASNVFVSGTATVGFLSASNTFVSGTATVGFVSATNTLVSGRSTVGFLTATNAFVSGIVTVGVLSATDVYVSDGIASISRLTVENSLVTGVSTFVGLITSSNIFVSGVVTAQTFYGNLVGLVTFATFADRSGISTNVIGGIASVTQLNVSGVSTVGFLTATNTFVSGVSTVGILSATNAFVSGAATVGFVSATNTLVSGRSTIGFLTASNAFVSGTATVGFLTANNINVSSAATVGFLTATNTFVSGISTVGFLTATNIFVSGVSTVALSSATSLFVVGVSTFTGVIDANDGAYIGNVQIGILDDNTINTISGNLILDSNSGTVQINDNLGVSGFSTFTQYITGNAGAFFGNIQIRISDDNIIDTKTGILVLDSNAGIVRVDDILNVTGFSTFNSNVAIKSSFTVSGASTVGFLSASNIFVSGVVTAQNFYGTLVGIASTAYYAYYADKSGISTNVVGGIASVTQLNVSGVSTVGFLTSSNAFVSGTATVGFLTATNAFVSGTATVGVLSATGAYVSGGATVGFLSASNTFVSGRSTVGFLSASNAFVSGTATVGFLTASNAFVSGVSTVGFLTATNVFVSGVVTAQTFYGNLVGVTSNALYADRSGISTNVIGGIASVTQLSVSGFSTFSEQITAEKSVLVQDNLIVQDKVGIGSDVPAESLDVVGNVAATGAYYGMGDNLVGIVTQLVPGIGIDLVSTQEPGKGRVKVQSYRPIGKTIYVSQTGDDNNTGLAENYPKRTIKAAASVALFGDTIKVFPGVYVEENPIVLAKTVSVEGTELRNCVATPRYTDRDLFYVNNGCHITDMSFIGPEMTTSSSIVSFQPLLGVEDFRYFDASRMIRFNLDYIARESVGFLTSGFSGFAGGHREQDAARLIDKNLDYIASETVGFLTSPIGYNFSLTGGNYTNCKEDVVSIMSAVSYDLKANSNRKSIGAALSYFNSSGGLIHITGISTQQATIAALDYAVGIAKSVINNVSPPVSYQSGVGSISQVKDLSVIAVEGGCVGVGSTIAQLVGIVTSAIGAASTSGLPTSRYGVNLETDVCARDVKLIWKAICHDITRGGNFKCVNAAKEYYDENWNLLPGILKNPEEKAQTIATVDYSFNVARSVINNSTWGGYPVGLGTTVVTAQYHKETGITTITAYNHGLVQNDAVKITGLKFTCPGGSGITTNIFPEGSFGYVFPVHKVIDINTFVFVGGISTITHTYDSGGTIQKYKNFQDQYTQVRDLSIQPDPETGFNNAINSCQNVVSAIRSCVGVVTSVVGLGSTSSIATRYSGNSGIGFTSAVGVTSAIYDYTSGKTTIKAPGLIVKSGEYIELYDLLFSCSSGITTSTQKFPSGYYGNEFCVNKIYNDGSFDIYVGVSTIPHAYESGGYIIDRSIGITTATYDNLSGITTITAPGAYVRSGDFVTLYNMQFSCISGAGTTTIYPTGKSGYSFQVSDVIGLGNTFVVNVGTSTIPHTYVSGGVVKPTYSKGVGNVTQGPYVRNCTNFVPGSIGMKVDGFHAEPGDLDDVGVTGAMSVDSYTQYNQGGIGVTITNGSYCQLVSIFTICTETAIFTGSGGQCDITNSNSSFGNYGLVSDGVGDNESGSIYRYTGFAQQTAEAEQDTVIISGIGSYRPYDGQAIYFGDLYYTIDRIQIIDGGYGYTSPPIVVIDPPTGPNGINAEGSANIDSNGRVISVDLISSGNQYKTPPSISFVGGDGVGAAATVKLYPTYYTIESATLPNAGITTIVLARNLNNTVSIGTTVYFSRLSLQIASSHSFEWIGAGNDIFKAKPGLGGVVIQENEIIKSAGGEIVYTSTDQAGNFRIGEGVVINQVTGTISGRAFSQSLLNTVTPLIIALSK